MYLLIELNIIPTSIHKIKIDNPLYMDIKELKMNSCLFTLKCRIHNKKMGGGILSEWLDGYFVRKYTIV